MAISRESRAFRDISLSFELTSCDERLAYSEERKSNHPFSSEFSRDDSYRKVFQPLLGSDVRASLFDFVDFATASVIEEQIITTVNNFGSQS